MEGGFCVRSLHTQPNELNNQCGLVCIPAAIEALPLVFVNCNPVFLGTF